MKFSLNWLREWIDPGLSAAALAEQFTMRGLEVESLARAAPPLAGVLVGEVRSVAPHPQAERLRVCQVDIRASQPLQIVCGAANVRAGLRVAVATPGTVLPGDKRITETELRGVRSQGMLCSAAELALGGEGEGILELDADAPIGRALEQWLELDDQILELNVTPNRGDCLGIIGIARELAAQCGLPFAAPDWPAVPAGIEDRFPVELLAPAACPRFVGRVLRGVRADAHSPRWMVERLRRSGIRAISPLVDVTNYVMLELGQPMHAYDLARLSGGIRVRLAAPGETLLLLDGQQLALHENTLVIADHRRALGAAGIMGGEASGIGSDTRDVLLESAYFAPLHLAGEARRYRMHTDASHRFERGVDFRGQERAIERATALILQICGGQAGPLTVAEDPAQLPARAPITVRAARLERMLGMDVPLAEAERILDRLGCAPARVVDGWTVTPPSHRFDIEREIDLIEEIARLHGYERVPATLPRVELSIAAPAGHLSAAAEARRTLVARGYHEAITYSFVEPELAALIEPSVDALRLSNPISADLAVMRTSLWPGLLKALRHNAHRQQDRIRLFEVGAVFLPGAGGLVQHTRVAGVASGPVCPEQWGSAARAVDFHDLRADIEALLACAGGVPLCLPEVHPALHPGQCALVKKDGESAGWIGALHPGLVRHLDLAGPVLLFELALDALVRQSPPAYLPVSRFPSVRRDLSVTVDAAVQADALLGCVRRHAGGLLKDLQLFDVYQGQGIESGKKSIALGLIFQASSSTLRDEDVDELTRAVVDGMRRELGATLRT